MMPVVVGLWGAPPCSCVACRLQLLPTDARACVCAQVIINCGVLPCIMQLLVANHKKSIKKEACWTLSNITAGTKEQIQAVFDANLVAPLVKLLATAEYDIKKEASWAISNATSGGTAEQVCMCVCVSICVCLCGP